MLLQSKGRQEDPTSSSGLRCLAFAADNLDSLKIGLLSFLEGSFLFEVAVHTLTVRVMLAISWPLLGIQDA